MTTVRTEVQGRVLVVHLEREAKRNAIDPEMTAGIGEPESGDGRFVVARTVVAGVIISIVGRTIGHGRITAVATGAVIVAKPSVGAPAVVTAMIIARASHTDTDRYLRGCRC